LTGVPIGALARLILHRLDADIEVVLDAITSRGSAVTANRARAYLSKFFNWCTKTPAESGKRARITETSPVAGTSAPTSERQRDRVLTSAGDLAFSTGGKAPPSLGSKIKNRIDGRARRQGSVLALA
jgi:hypothetical protein